MRIKLLAMDVDGTMTDGQIYIGHNGEVMKAFDVKDGFGIKEFIKRGGITVVITGRTSEIVKERCRELGIHELFQGTDNKLKCLRETANKYSIDPEGIAYIGDDRSDLDCINYAGSSACPSDAVSEIKNAVDFVCTNRGGHGAVREFIEWFTEEE